MRHFIFITTEGHTYQPESEATKPDIENSQVLGFGSGSEVEEAFRDFVEENEWLKDTTFNKVIVYELRDEAVVGYFYLKDA